MKEKGKQIGKKRVRKRWIREKKEDNERKEGRKGQRFSSSLAPFLLLNLKVLSITLLLIPPLSSFLFGLL